MEDEQMSYYDKKLERRWEFARYIANFFIKIILPVSGIISAWIYIHWIAGVIAIISWFIFVSALSIVRVGSIADKMSERAYFTLLKKNAEKEAEELKKQKEKTNEENI